jgi:hypothetical protein
MYQQVVAIVIAGALIAAAIALTNHWAVQGGQSGVPPLLLNRWTGTVVMCTPHNGHLRCPGKF